MRSIADALEGCSILKHSDSLENAVLQAHQLAQKGDTVLFSPACASFDMFSGFAARGESFVIAVKNFLKIDSGGVVLSAVSMTGSRSSQLLDYELLFSILILLGLGIVMVASTSMGISESKFGNPFHYLSRQLLFVVVGGVFAVAVFKLPLQLWQHIGFILLLVSAVLLVAVLIPDVGKTVNGSSRWLPMGPFNFQVSEFVKLVVPIYMAGYLVRHAEEVRGSFTGFLKPMGILSVFGVCCCWNLTLEQLVIIMATALGMLFCPECVLASSFY